MTHPLFAPEVHEILEADDRNAMRDFCENLHPATVAETLAGELAVEQVWRFLDTTNIANQAAIFAYFPLEWQAEMVEGIGRKHMAQLIEKMSHDDRADLLRRLPPKVTESLLRLVDEADRRDIAQLVKYPENTAGALMTTDYAWLTANITVEDALERLRLQAPDKETIYYVYVVDDQRRLLGVVSLRDLILASRRATLQDLMERNVLSAYVTDDREEVAQKFSRFDLLAIPVVDTEGRLVGIITYDDIMDVVVSEATEDVHRMGAVGAFDENYLEASFVLIWRKRAVWLALLFVAELFTFTALSHFEDAIAEVVVLSLFVPLCISTGGNSGSQAATLITRAMALGHVSGKDFFRVVRHEFAMGLVLGLTLGGIGFVRGYLTPKSVRTSAPPRLESFTVTVDQPLAERITDRKRNLFGKEDIMVRVKIPAGAAQVIESTHEEEIELPENVELPEPIQNQAGQLIYTFPPKCSSPRRPVDAWRLAQVIGLAVAAICLCGTLVGSMLPMFLKRLGFDPGYASSPFVATFVDVAGILVYFWIAKAVLYDVLM